MTCKLGDECDNGKLCAMLRKDVGKNVQLLGCSHFVPKKPLTNEEWLRTASTEQLAEFLADKCNEAVDWILYEVDEHAGKIDPDDYWYRKDAFVEWLKEVHQ